MRYSVFAVLGLFATATIAPVTAHAAGNVLLPSTSTNSGTPMLPSLGLGDPATTSNDTSAATQTPADTNQTDTTQTSTPALSSSRAVSTISKEEAAGLPPGAIPTTVMHTPDISSYQEKAGKDLPYTLTLSMSGKSIFGANDVQKITSRLGLRRSRVASSCILAMRGLMQTDKGAYILEGGTSPKIKVHYDGMIKNYQMAAQAWCTVDNKLPLDSGVLTEMNNRYDIPLEQITCPVPNQQVTSLTITYDGSGTSQCVYK
ncbi:MAG: hypothetical protein P4M13_02005 [Alphaproteobacteria bacterium]|nr:hypothetical protein [Alphaproteobacteria bacterium]